ncbi:aminotransferase class I/II-fold pyridoxal phosphate-dependent enzyme [Desertivirga brevis]|uniref:aminotransferase class I/II-fold pyridoxal phosphate-dependent enzyme n=1 Tax=Desertivirga brevis TaxID=2810310 RepID=UPI001A975434|nr:8-amino-7-oxononanoate synthase [Pedobacter sp. SYSU D00873]
MKPIENYILKRLEDRETNNSYRTLSTDHSLIDFCSNDYLGFARSSLLQDNIREALAATRTLSGSTGSRLISGNDYLTEQLEASISVFHGAQAGLLFNSGYDANVGIFSSLPQRGDTIIADELIHASIIDGARLSFANRYSFRHNDLESLREKLESARGRIYIAIESIYSMDGDMAPLEAILDLADLYEAAVIVDEAHATGIFGAKGEGLVHHRNLQDRVFARIVTFGKALGCHGAIVLGSVDLRSYLVNFARSFIYTTSAPPLNHISISEAYKYLEAGDYPAIASSKINFFRSEAGGLYNSFIDSNSPIQCLMAEGNDHAKRMEGIVKQAGYNVRAILHPTVPAGKERLRICLHSFNTESEINGLLDILKQNL